MGEMPKKEEGQGASQETIESEPGFEYKILKDPEVRQLIMERVDQMVQKVFNEEFSNLVFLDKSARPLSTLFSDLWNKQFGDKRKPDVNYLNVGKEIDFDFRKSVKDKGFVGKVEAESLSEVAKAFAPMKKSATKILIVDEYKASGGSLAVANKLLSHIASRTTIEEYAIATEDGTKDGANAKLINFFDERGWSDNVPGEDTFGLTGVIDSYMLDDPETARAEDSAPKFFTVPTNKFKSSWREKRNAEDLETHIQYLKARLSKLKKDISDPEDLTKKFKKDLQKAEKRLENLKKGDYVSKIADFRAELHHAADEYWEHKKDKLDK